MTIAVKQVTLDSASLRIEICPVWYGKCQCPDPATMHSVTTSVPRPPKSVTLRQYVLTSISDALAAEAAKPQRRLQEWLGQFVGVNATTVVSATVADVT